MEQVFDGMYEHVILGVVEGDLGLELGDSAVVQAQRRIDGM